MDVMETKTDMIVAKESTARVWLFRVLVVIGAGLMLVSWFKPWWNLDIEELGYDMVRIRPWGLEMDERLGSFTILLKGAPMPSWFAPMMWALLALLLIALLVGLLVGGKKIVIGKFNIKLATLLIAGVGGVFIVIAAVAAIYASMRMGAMFGAPLQGRTSVDMGGELHSFVDTHLLPGYYLAYVAGFWLLVIGLLRGIIIGKPQPDA